MKKERFMALGLLVAIVIFLGVFALAEEVRDPVCGMKLDPAKAKFSTEYMGKKYYFCSADCQAEFKKNPGKYVPSMEPSADLGAVCCSLSKEMMAEVKLEKKETPDGLEITMTSTKSEVVKKLQETLGECHQEMIVAEHGEPCQKKQMMEKQAHGEHMAQHQHATSETGTKATCCLMHDKNYEVKLINLNNGVRLELKKKS